jgi:hypothetical protein
VPVPLAASHVIAAPHVCSTSSDSFSLHRLTDLPHLGQDLLPVTIRQVVIGQFSEDYERLFTSGLGSWQADALDVLHLHVTSNLGSPWSENIPAGDISGGDHGCTGSPAGLHAAPIASRRPALQLQRA